MSALAGAARPVPQLRFWNRSFLALVMAPAFPIGDWFAELDAQLATAPAFFRDRPVVVDLSAVVEQAGPQAGAIVLEGFEERALRIVGVEGIEAALLANTPWARLGRALPGRDLPGDALARPAAEETPPVPSLLVERPVRSGQSVVFQGGDVTVVGAVASGAEVIAGGSIHVYGPLRGRAIAGLRAGDGARIFCARMEAELVGIDKLYRTSEHWGPTLHGRAVQVRCDRGGLRILPLD